MKLPIFLIMLALLAILVGSAWSRHGDWEMTGESGAILLGLLLSVMAVALVLWL